MTTGERFNTCEIRKKVTDGQDRPELRNRGKLDKPLEVPEDARSKLSIPNISRGYYSVDSVNMNAFFLFSNTLSTQ
jgi:hypothetical protein